ncbi:MAG TPA: hypothetical protein V6C78_09660 [Crinalium sp.]|jgi:hypothetical protein
MLQLIRQMVISAKTRSVLAIAPLAIGSTFVAFGATPAQADRIVIQGNISVGDGRYFPNGDRYSGDRWDRRDSHRGRYDRRPYIVDSEIEDSTLINPVIIDSSIEDSTLINPTFTNRSRYDLRPSTPAGSCMYFANIRAACQ